MANNNQNLDLPEFGRVTTSTDVTYSNTPTDATAFEDKGILQTLKMAFTPGGNEMSGYSDPSIGNLTENITQPIFQYAWITVFGCIVLALFAVAWNYAWGGSGSSGSSGEEGKGGLRDGFLWKTAKFIGIPAFCIMLIAAFVGGHW